MQGQLHGYASSSAPCLPLNPSAQHPQHSSAAAPMPCSPPALTCWCLAIRSSLGALLCARQRSKGVAGWQGRRGDGRARAAGHVFMTLRVTCSALKSAMERPTQGGSERHATLNQMVRSRNRSNWTEWMGSVVVDVHPLCQPWWQLVSSVLAALPLLAAAAPIARPVGAGFSVALLAIPITAAVGENERGVDEQQQGGGLPDASLAALPSARARCSMHGAGQAQAASHP